MMAQKGDLAMKTSGLDRVSMALPHPLLLVAENGMISDANPAAEAFFDIGRAFLQRMSLEKLCGPSSAIASMVDEARAKSTSFNIYRVDLRSQRMGGERLADIHASPMPDDPGTIILMIQERTIADKFDRQFDQRGAVRSVSGLSAMLAHEIKNPLSGIRGAAQLLDSSVPDEDRILTQLIRDETDRIVKLVDRFEMFTDNRALQMEEVNIHVVLDHVRHLAQSGFARHIRLSVEYDPSLPDFLCNRDQMVQVLLNLVKNAAEAIGEAAIDGEIVLSTAYRPGVRIAVPGSAKRVRLPLEVCVRDNGPGVADDIRQHLFNPFVTTKASGNGLGLALVAKVIGDHGGIIECDSVSRRTVFRLLLPLQSSQQENTRPEGEGTDRL
ncbi:MAG: two-component system sensor histidine kinase NtrB [Beijerinckiaceae bacterium]